MSDTNPKKAVKALFPEDIKIADGLVVHPLTLGHYALLEKIGSFLAAFDHDPDPIEVVKTYYICTHDSKYVLKHLDTLDDDAMDWADTIPRKYVDALGEALYKQINAMTDVIPEVQDDKKKEAPVTDS